jgi:hypothetical protein
VDQLIRVVVIPADVIRSVHRWIDTDRGTQSVGQPCMCAGASSERALFRPLRCRRARSQ